jgi:hypothetical protein
MDIGTLPYIKDLYISLLALFVHVGTLPRMPGYPKDAMYTYAMRMALLGFPIMQALDDGMSLTDNATIKKALRSGKRRV